MLDKPVLIYDEQCPLCKRFKQGLEFMDLKKKIEFRDANDDQTYKDYPQLTQDQCLTEAHFLRENGDLLTGGDIIAEISHYYPGVKKLSWLLESNMGKKVNDYFYKKVEQLRKSSLRGCSGCGKS